jgi:hypothetical protein
MLHTLSLRALPPQTKLSDFKEGQVLTGEITEMSMLHGFQIDLGGEYDGCEMFTSLPESKSTFRTSCSSDDPSNLVSASFLSAIVKRLNCCIGSSPPLAARLIPVQSKYMWDHLKPECRSSLNLAKEVTVRIHKVGSSLPVSLRIPSDLSDESLPSASETGPSMHLF